MTSQQPESALRRAGLRAARLNDVFGTRPGPVLVWLQRSLRSRSSLLLNLAVAEAEARQVPVICLFVLDAHYPHASVRTHSFVLEGLPALEQGLRQRNMSLSVQSGETADKAARFARDLGASLVLTDHSHLRFGRRRRERVASRLAADGIPLWSVDNDVVVPVTALGKEQYAARTIRPRLQRLAAEYLHPIPDPAARVTPPEVHSDLDFQAVSAALSRLDLDRRVGPARGFRGGEDEARARLQRFVAERLPRYHLDRNNGAFDGTSGLSPYLHFGQIDPWTIALAVHEAPAPPEAKASYLDELLIRRELAANFTTYNPQYDCLLGLPDWARRTLEEHRRDPRPAVCSLQQLEQAETADDLWNAAQRELLETGSMHGWVRMYWGKRIIEWTDDPADALAHALYLNNRYALDGRDPVSYANILWCFGKHDRPWPSRPIFGSVRSMSRAGAERKFDVARYIARVS